MRDTFIKITGTLARVQPWVDSTQVLHQDAREQLEKVKTLWFHDSDAGEGKATLDTQRIQNKTRRKVWGLPRL